MFFLSITIILAVLIQLFIETKIILNITIYLIYIYINLKLYTVIHTRLWNIIIGVLILLNPGDGI